MLRHGCLRIGAPFVVDAVRGAIGRHPDRVRVTLASLRGANLVTHRPQLADDLITRTVGLDRRLVRQPLVVYACEIHSLPAVEPVFVMPSTMVRTVLMIVRDRRAIQ